MVNSRTLPARSEWYDDNALETLANPLDSSTRSPDPLPEPDGVVVALLSGFCISCDRPDSAAAVPVKSRS